MPRYNYVRKTVFSGDFQRLSLHTRWQRTDTAISSPLRIIAMAKPYAPSFWLGLIGGFLGIGAAFHHLISFFYQMGMGAAGELSGAGFSDVVFSGLIAFVFSMGGIIGGSTQDNFIGGWVMIISGFVIFISIFGYAGPAFLCLVIGGLLKVIRK
ncbi:hypothetical protein J2T58_001691 [Methanocalculus alkaliphilus]|uniref:hypothetical protein n=1 Tax=Methanocalculus alkaliphilus TaxID=768730 RepID=UPI00209FA261|nr:hypothetical protein [Methanocalculus alkaliphilus]MCP1715820.1 hypothetical protein [Methanocalculus alkaliphilus]